MSKLYEVLPETNLPLYIYIYIYQNIYKSNNKKGFHILKKARSRKYPAKTMTDTDYADNLALLANTPTHAESLPSCLEQSAEGIGFYMNANKTE